VTAQITEPGLEISDHQRLQAVVNPAAALAIGDQPRLLQHPQMEGQLGLGEIQIAGQITDAAFTLPQLQQDPLPGGIRQGLEQAAGLIGAEPGVSGVLLHQSRLIDQNEPVNFHSPMRIGINGFGRIGRLVFRALWGRPGIELVHVNDPAGDAVTAAHLLEFDSVHGRWDRGISSDADGFSVQGSPLTWSSSKDITAVPWKERGVEMVLEASGKIKTPETLNPYFDSVGLKRVIVGCPVKGEVAGEEALNIVYGINHHLYEPHRHRLITAASCTTNCLAPVVKVVHETFGIEHGMITTIHDITNTQVPIDAFKSDLRRARSGLTSLIPTTTGSAKAIAMIFPELKGKLNGHAVRVPLLNGSLTDAVFELQQSVTVEQVNAAFRAAAEGPLKGILGYEERPLVSCDYTNDDRSSIVDALSTMVVDDTQLKVFAWYDNEWGYSCRMADLTCRVVELDA